ncbi:hypothetical protein L7F22_024913 [Adiantum nelumboides]|nr:hypothetical protein [Adiantum nelumboides]
MSRSLQCWEKDPFFSAAEQVQDSADRLESAFRAWIHAKSLSPDAQAFGSIDFCRRELRTAFGIAKWQLEEFEKEVSVLTLEPHVDDNVPQRRQQFVEAISSQLSSIQNALVSSNDWKDRKIRLGQEESDELAHFLCGSRMNAGDSAEDTSSSCSKTDIMCRDVALGSLFSSGSGKDCRKALTGSVEKCSSDQETGISGCSNDHCLSSEMSTSKRGPVHMLEVSINVGNDESGAGAAAGLLHGDFCESVGLCIERANGPHQIASVGGSVSCCTERASGHSRTLSAGAGSSCCNDSGELRIAHKHASSCLTSNIWSNFFKTDFFTGSRVSQSVLKRLKDGEGDPMDFCEMCDGDIESKCSSFLCQYGKRYKGCSEWSQILRSSRTVFTSELARKITVILTVLGLLGLYLY